MKDARARERFWCVIHLDVILRELIPEFASSNKVNPGQRSKEHGPSRLPPRSAHRLTSSD